MRRVIAALALLLPAACSAGPQLVMVNPATGATVGCAIPDFSADSGQFLVSRECISACQAHGFRPDPTGRSGAGDSAVPQACQN